MCYRYKVANAFTVSRMDTLTQFRMMQVRTSVQSNLRPFFCTIMREVFIRHINPLMFDVIDDKPEGVARGVYNV